MDLVLLRHGESEWNRLNLFTGWTDVPLSQKGEIEAFEAGKILSKEHYDFDVCYTSVLKRAIHTLNFALEGMDRDWLPVKKSWLLNERHYGALQGLNKKETAEKYGEEQVQIWRRSFDVAPPLVTAQDSRNPKLQPQYREQMDIVPPLGESLKDTIARVVPYFLQTIVPEIFAEKRVFIVAHGNSLRALVMHLEELSPEEIMEMNIPTGIPLAYQLDELLKVKNKKYLGDPKAIADKIATVANQGKK
ncbi:MAG: 2,3-diphosphoglycerate-dependent phosphoglycerate mutase [Clostridiales bacterium]|nr:2,3-diphosphoglycerate-dependent phosphoglycerate mutase [Clostridiales bacterium]